MSGQTEIAPARVEFTQQDDAVTVELHGDWALELPPPRFAPLIEARMRQGAVRSIAFDASALGTWDSSLLTFLGQAMQYGEAHGIACDTAGLPPNIAQLLGLANAVPALAVVREKSPSSFVDRVGTAGIAFYDSSLVSITFLGEVADGFGRVLRRRVRMRWRDFWVVVQSNSSGALPIVTLIAFLVGLIISFLGAVVLRRLGAGYYVSYLVGFGMLREMAALMTGIIIAGRTGAAFAAEIGTMKVTEELDALQTLGLSPVEQLVLPRVLALFVMMPLLTVYAMFVGIGGGMLVAVTMLDLNSAEFMGGLLTPLTLSDGMLGVFKGTVFGLIIGIAGCMRGMQTGTDAGAVGRAATSAVVTGITLTVGANALIDWLAVLTGV